MFKANYIKEDGYRVDIIFLEENIIGSFKSNTLKEAIEKYIKFEEEYYGYEFTNEEIALKHRNVELTMELLDGDSIDEDALMQEIFAVNMKLQRLYTDSGFDKIRNAHKIEFLNAEAKEIEEGVEIDG